MRTFAGQDQIPNLPVPQLEHTIQRFMESARALGSPRQISATEAAVQQFMRPGGDGEQLQKMLLQRAKQKEDEGSNWLADWWLKYAYTLWRVPLEITTSFAMNFLQPIDPAHPCQLSRATSLLHSLMTFQYLLTTEQVEPDKDIEGKPLCMDGYRVLFGSARIPEVGNDRLSLNPNSRHVVALRHGVPYVFDVLDMEGRVLPIDTMASHIQWVLQQGDPQSVRVCGLTGGERDGWARTRTQLVDTSAQNRASLNLIDSALIVLCLDDIAPKNDLEYHRLLWHSDGRNRWFDKLQLVVFANGAAGVVVEHTPGDGLIALRAVEYAIPQAAKLPPIPNPTHLAPAARLQFDVPETVAKAVETALNQLRELADRHQLVPVKFKHFGRSALRSLRMSPDAFVQLAFQLTLYRLLGKFVGTYESTHTRKFRFGRTEVTRSCTSEAVAFAKAFDDLAIPNSRKIDLMKAAANMHVRTARLASSQQGIDRHFLGLRLLAKHHLDHEVPLFNDELFQYSSTWRHSTSQLSSPLATVSFGPVVEDGWGLWYGIVEDQLYFTVTSELKTPVPAQKYADALQKTLLDMMALLKTPAAKL